MQRTLAHACYEQSCQSVADSEQIVPDAPVDDLSADVLPPGEAEQSGNEQLRIAEMRDRMQSAEDIAACQINKDDKKIGQGVFPDPGHQTASFLRFVKYAQKA